MRKRVIPVLLLKNGYIVRSEKFSIHQLIGNPLTELERFSDWAVDEIIYLNISRDENVTSGRDDHKVKVIDDRYELLKEISRHCFVPLGFGGGIRNLKDIEKTLNCGADKVVLNSVLFKDERLLSEAARVFGSQALIACVDYKGGKVFHSYGTIDSGATVEEWCLKLEEQGVGEIVLQSIERDGSGRGYDIKTIKKIVDLLSVPVIPLGGVGDYFDFVECFEGANPSAVAAGNIFHFKEHSDYHIKQTLLSAGIDVRKTWGE